jgi:hypothetical protein
MREGGMKRRGRPPIDDQGGDSVPVCVRLPAAQYDELYQRAQRNGQIGVPEQIRRDLQEPASDRRDVTK